MAPTSCHNRSASGELPGSTTHQFCSEIARPTRAGRLCLLFAPEQAPLRFAPSPRRSLLRSPAGRALQIGQVADAPQASIPR